MIAVPPPYDPFERHITEVSAVKLAEDYLPRYLAALDALSAEDLWWKGGKHMNSVGNLVLHVCGNLRQWIVHGVGGADDVRDRNAEFAASGSRSAAALRSMLEITIRECAAVIRTATMDELRRVRRIQVYDVTGFEAITHAVEHASYHLGQVVLLAKLRKDVDFRFYDL